MSLSDVKFIPVQPKFEDSRGTYQVVYNTTVLPEGLHYSQRRMIPFAQESEVFSSAGVLRGLHYQEKIPQGKLIRVLYGTIYDTAVDLRSYSPDFGKYVSYLLGTGESLWIPPGFAHGYSTLTNSVIYYKVTEPWYEYLDRTINPLDSQLNIPWKFPDGVTAPILSEKDRNGLPFSPNKKYY